MRLVIAAMAVLGMACSSEGDPRARVGGGGDACGALHVVVDGKELTGLGPVYGVRLTKGTATVWHVEAADGAALSCEEVLRGGRAIRKGENVVAADISSDRSYFTGVRLGGHTLSAFQPDKLVRLDVATPTKVGDPIAICVDTDVVKGVSKGLEIHGALRGTYCGEP